MGCSQPQSQGHIKKGTEVNFESDSEMCKSDWRQFALVHTSPEETTTGGVSAAGLWCFKGVLW